MERTDTHQRFPFLKLPPELRELVYEHIAGKGRSYRMMISHRHPTAGNEANWSEVEQLPKNGLAVPRINRQIRAEAHPFFFGPNSLSMLLSYRFDFPDSLDGAETYDDLREMNYILNGSDIVKCMSRKDTRSQTLHPGCLELRFTKVDLLLHHHMTDLMAALAELSQLGLRRDCIKVVFVDNEDWDAVPDAQVFASYMNRFVDASYALGRQASCTCISAWTAKYFNLERKERPRYACPDRLYEATGRFVLCRSENAPSEAWHEGPTCCRILDEESRWPSLLGTLCHNGCCTFSGDEKDWVYDAREHGTRSD